MRDWTPPPQLTEHGSHSFHVDTQSAGHACVLQFCCSVTPPHACPLLVGQNDTTAAWPGSAKFGPSHPHRSSEPPKLRRLRSSSGFCSVTGVGDAGNCDAEMGFSGSWGWQDGVRTLAGCVRACWRYCRACRYVSFSHKINDCSWYRVCDMNNLGAKDNADGLSSREVTIVARMVVLGAAVAGRLDDQTTTPQ